MSREQYAGKMVSTVFWAVCAVLIGGMVSTSALAAADTADQNPAFAEMDGNHDGKISKEEWFAAGMSAFSYEGLFGHMLDADHDGYVSQAEFTGGQPQFEVDTNHDGKTSMKEFVTANNKAGEEMQAKGGMPDGAPNGAPNGAGGPPPSK